MVKMKHKWQGDAWEASQIFDCKNLQKQLNDAGYEVSIDTIYLSWLAFSSELCAQWLVLHKDLAVNVKHLLNHMEEMD